MAKKKKNAPTPEELALPEEYMTAQPMPFKKSVGFLTDRLASTISNWMLVAGALVAILIAAPILYWLVAGIIVAANFFIVIIVGVFTVGLIFLSAPFSDMMPTIVLLNGDWMGIVYGQVLPVVTVVTFVLSIVSTLLLFLRIKTSAVWRIVLGVLTFALYLTIFILHANGVIVYG